MIMKSALTLLFATIFALSVPSISHAGKGRAKNAQAAADKGGRHKHHHRVRHFLRRLDADKNGKIEGAEADKLRKVFAEKPKAKKRLQRMDKNQDGQLDDSEISAIHVKHKGEKGKKAKTGKKAKHTKKAKKQGRKQK